MSFFISISLAGQHVNDASPTTLFQVDIRRNRGLSKLKLHSIFSLDLLRASGTFHVTGWVGWAGYPSVNINSDGEKLFEAKLVNATLEPVIEIDIDRLCDEDGNALVTAMSVPLVYDDITFDTGGVNYFVNDAFVGALTFLFEKTNLEATASVRKVVQSYVNRWLCPSNR